MHTYIHTYIPTYIHTTKAPRVIQKYKSVPWLTKELTELRKTTNALRRKYQRTRDNTEQREKNKAT
jgi:hypothetical protein